MTKKNNKKALAVPELTEQELAALKSADAELRASGLVTLFDRTLPALPTNYQFTLRDRQFIENAFNACFDLIGGVPRLAVWADQNPAEFYKLYAKLMPEAQKGQQQATQINITNNIARSPLDDATFADAHTVDSGDGDE